MSLQAILDRIRATEDLQIKIIQAESEKEVQAILAEARAEADRLYKEGFRQALAPEAGERSAVLNLARFDAVCLTGRAREELASAALAEVVQQLKETRSSPVYPRLLERILLEMLPGQDGNQSLEDRLILEADPRDRELLECILREKQMRLRVEYSLSCWGGLNGRTPDGSIHLVNTLESRLERILPFLKKRLVEWFTQEPTGEKELQPVKEKNPA